MSLQMHFGREWPDNYSSGQETIEDRCSCRTEPCGLISETGLDPNCPQHSMMAARTMRSGHRADACPGAAYRERKPVEE